MTWWDGVKRGTQPPVEQNSHLSSVLAASVTSLMIGRGGLISHEDTVANVTSFSGEVLPHLARLG